MPVLKIIVPIAAAGLLTAACGTTTEQRVATGAVGGAVVDRSKR